MKILSSFSAGKIVWRIEGACDEDAAGELQRLGMDSTSAHVVIDMAGLTRINSIGANVWSQGLGFVLERCSVELLNCPVMFVDYCNFFPGMVAPTPQPGREKARAEIKSFAVPYHCESCQKGFATVVEVGEIEEKALPRKSCRTCGEELEAEVNSDDYLTFLYR